MALITSDCCFGKGITGKTTDAAYKQRVVMDPCIGNGAPPLPLPGQRTAGRGLLSQPSGLRIPGTARSLALSRRGGAKGWIFDQDPIALVGSHNWTDFSASVAFSFAVPAAAIGETGILLTPALQHY